MLGIELAGCDPEQTAFFDLTDAFQLPPPIVSKSALPIAAAIMSDPLSKQFPLRLKLPLSPSFIIPKRYHELGLSARVGQARNPRARIAPYSWKPTYFPYPMPPSAAFGSAHAKPLQLDLPLHH